MRNPVRLLSAARQLGLRDVAFYALHRARLSSGWYRRRLPAGDWTPLPAEWLAGARSPFGVPERERIVATCADPDAVIAAAERIIGGELLYFSRHWLQTRRFESTDVHFSQVRLPHDVKWIWEPSRFDWVYTLVRAWGVSGDRRYIDKALAMVREWREANPPNRGIHWSNAQECAIRLFAIVFLAAFEPAPILFETAAALAENIDASIAYSRSQRNNHLLAEATALYLTGSCLPKHPKSAAWKETGWTLTIEAIVDQFAADGSYIFHSTNYAREALRDALVFALAARAFGDALPPLVIERLRAAARFLYELQDESGRVPNYGHNDGSNYMSLSTAAYDDFRPIVQSVSIFADGATPYEPGPQDEETAWLFPSWQRKHTPIARKSEFRADDGGYYVIRQPNSWAMLRCHTFRARPAQSDMLHFDFWTNGVNALCDGGIFDYGDPQGRNRHLESVRAHNTVTVNDEDPMTKAGSFLWTNWTRAKLIDFTRRDDAVVEWSGEHYGYERFGITHRRTVYAAGDDWMIVDDLLCDPSTRFTAAVRWHIHPAANIRIDVAGGADFKTGNPSHIETAMSRHYGELEPVGLLERRASSVGPLRFTTIIGDGERWKGKP